MHVCSTESLLMLEMPLVASLNTDKIGKYVPETKFLQGFREYVV